MGNKYKSPNAFKAALDAKLKNRAEKLSRNMQRERQLCIFSQFLARVNMYFADRIVLKGGFALELRTGNARTTKDIDFSLSAPPENLLETFQKVGALSGFDDYMTFEVRKPKHSTINNEGLVYEGFRFGVECKLAGRTYGNAFTIDVALGKVNGRVERIQAVNYLEFIELTPTTISVIPIETHIAEKIHAYTVPPEKGNSRIKDLPDIAMLASIGTLSSTELKNRFDETFKQRNTHQLPKQLAAPPNDWTDRYERIASRDNLEWKTIEHLFQKVAVFTNPILENGNKSFWDPSRWTWS